jgi:CHAD domain-containing protein
VEAHSREYDVDEPGPRLPGRLRDELMTTFAVDEDRGVTRVRRTWLDTFDWRLARAGLALQHAGTRGHGELVLTGTAGQQLTARFANPARPPRWPCLADALPPGPLRDQVTAAAGLRALLPVVTAVSQVHEVRLRNADEKTVSRIAVDAMALAGPCPAPLPTRLTVTGVRGYPGAARRAGRILGGTAGVTLSGQTALEAALHAAGRHALDYTGKVDVTLHPAMPGAEAVTAILLQQLDTLEANVDGVLHDTDIEFLHDLRIAVRRTRSALKLLGDMLPGELTLRFASEFRWLGDITTPLRDLDVQLLSVPPMAAGLVAAHSADLDPFLAYLARRRTAERRTLGRALRSARFAAVTGDWRKALLVPRETRGRAGLHATELSADRTRRAYGRVLKLGSAIIPGSPPESLHTLRKRGKELRYVLEFFASLHDPRAYRAVLSDLKRLQDCLGEFQDSQVQQEEIQALAAAMLAAGAAPAPTLLAMGELAAHLGLRQRQARAEFAERFAGFAGDAGRRRMAVLTGEDPG